MEKIRKEWEILNPTRPFDYFFIDETFNKNYINEVQTTMIMKILTFIAILLCSMGLFGLSILITSKKIKEIGIRKVNGAKITEVIGFLNRNFIVWVISAFTIAAPITWIFINKWLEGFAYKVQISWWTFAFSGFLALAIAMATASWQSWMAARRNPVEALRYE